MSDFLATFRSLYGRTIPAEESDIADFLRLDDSGALSGIIGDVSLIHTAPPQGVPIETGVDCAFVFMWVNQPRHVDYYCFDAAREAAGKSAPVIVVADQTVVQEWTDFRAFLEWLRAQQ